MVIQNNALASPFLADDTASQGPSFGENEETQADEQLQETRWQRLRYDFAVIFCHGSGEVRAIYFRAWLECGSLAGRFLKFLENMNEAVPSAPCANNS